MFKYNIYIESEVIVLPLVIYAETRETAYKKAVKQFRRIFKKKKITRVTIHKEMLKEKRQQGLKPKYEYNSATHKNDIEWVPVKMPTVKHSSKVFY